MRCSQHGSPASPAWQTAAKRQPSQDPKRSMCGTSRRYGCKAAIHLTMHQQGYAAHLHLAKPTPTDEAAADDAAAEDGHGEPGPTPTHGAAGAAANGAAAEGGGQQQQLQGEAVQPVAQQYVTHSCCYTSVNHCRAPA
jgi:hypothetical protein